MNIAVVFTGGTIGSVTKKSISLDGSTSYALLEHFNMNDPDTQVTFHTSSPYTLLSENLELSDVERLIVHIQELLALNFDGIIITHGSDTLSFTSTLLGTFFANISIPLFLIASHSPLDAVHSNALPNFETAVSYIVQNLPSGVFVAYANENHSHVTLHHACELTTSPQLSNDFYSFKAHYGSFTNKKFTLKPFEVQKKVYEFKPKLARKLLYIKPTPAIDYDFFALDDVEVVLHDLYHSGTVNEKKFLIFLQRCHEKHIPVFCAPIAKRDVFYDSTVHLQNYDVHFLYNISIELALAQLLISFGNTNDFDEISNILAISFKHKV